MGMGPLGQRRRRARRGVRARLLTSCPPCGEDVAAWCRARGVAHGPDGWAIEIRR